jgi:hypothetical protein
MRIESIGGREAKPVNDNERYFSVLTGAGGGVFWILLYCVYRALFCMRLRTRLFL